MNYSEMDEKLKSVLKPERYTHSKGVEALAVKLAEIHGADVQKARIAGLLHDSAKNLDKSVMAEIIGKITDDKNITEFPPLWHGPVGAYLLKREYGVDDAEIYDAVFYHTTGKKDMSLLTKIIYIADATEPGRDRYFDWAESCRKIAEEDIDAALLETVDRSVISVISRKLAVNPATVELHNELIKKQKIY